MRQILLLFLSITLLPCLPAQHFTIHQLAGLKVRNIGPAGMSGRVTAIDVVVAHPEIIYAGTASGGVWRSNSGGINWEPVFDDAPVQSIGAIAIYQKNPSVIWVGTGEGNPRNSHNSGMGIFKSIDGGKTWKLVGLKESKLIHRIRLHPDNPDIAYAAALGSAWGPNPERGVFKTTDGGKTWNKILFVNDSTGCAELVMDPSNPNKLIAAMWDFHRKPYYFESGGPGSGLYMSYDGGANWTEITAKDGLPEGILGRIGLAIAPGKPNIVYALIEAKKNGVYKSTDGGHSWTEISSDSKAGNRPFYYSEIYVDPKNENRIYSLWTNLSRSEDGGKTWANLLPLVWVGGIHPDHHAMWIHPDNPDYIIDGNDGGLNISHDGGSTWRFVENLPLCQFYHINYDMSIPYRVGGGMQDNGSWIGPSRVWQSGGIRNHHWQEILFGDGFDVVFQPGRPHRGYAMSQGGNVRYIDFETGKTWNIRPIHPDSIELRFNWNAAIAQNPFDSCGIYFGSQFVHKSSDCGTSWEIISPDLTTNDTMKQRLSQNSGGLTPDVTAAENFTTITALAPSPLDENVLWVGTDDGNVQLTQDGGASWQQLNTRLPGFPDGAWIPQIVASTHTAGEAFVVVNDYRRNDFSPYLYHTTDAGKSWARIINENSVEGYVRSIVQDPVEPRLLFAGTDRGLYISFDYGTNWKKWDNDFPDVPVADLKIHPREHDLIIGTFGRSVWILDDIRPLREIAASGGAVLEEQFAVFDVPDSYLAQYKSVEGGRFVADGTWVGANQRRGAMITIWRKPEIKKEEAPAPPSKRKRKDRKHADLVKAEKELENKDSTAQLRKSKPTDKAKVTVLDVAGDTIRNFSVKVDTGMFRFYWSMTRNGVRFPSRREAKPNADPPRGPSVLPGKYTLHFDFNGNLDSTVVTVHNDPRLEISREELEAEMAAREEIYDLAALAARAYDRLREAKKTIDVVNKSLINAPDSIKKIIKESGKNQRQRLDSLQQLILPPTGQKGIRRHSKNLNRQLYQALAYIGASDGKPTESAQIAMAKAKTETERILAAVNVYFENGWQAYRATVEAAQRPLFKNYAPLRLE